MKIILIEDERELAAVIEKGLVDAGYTVETAHDGEEGLYMMENIAADVVVLDLMLPGLDGLEVLARARRAGVKTPVLLLTARDGVEDRIAGLDTGADDYLTKPFDFGELLARLRSLLRRAAQAKESVLRIGGLEVDTASRSVRLDGEELKLSAREYAILELLAYNAGRVLSRTFITEHIYSEDFDMDSNIIDVYVSRLRNKIDRGRQEKLIHTVRGAGYMLRAGDAGQERA
ncbi:MAG TPA: response regulator transcription factor [Deltaproteobacteria bacterium]|nr:response regulator transcription factor [Deltaproteobacteria bacterium]